MIAAWAEFAASARSSAVWAEVKVRSAAASALSAGAPADNAAFAASTAVATVESALNAWALLRPASCSDLNTAAGLLAVWSTIRLEMMRGLEIGDVPGLDHAWVRTRVWRGLSVLVLVEPVDAGLVTQRHAGTWAIHPRNEIRGTAARATDRNAIGVKRRSERLTARSRRVTRIGPTREGIVGSAELLLARDQIVVGAVNPAKAPGQLRVRYECPKHRRVVDRVRVVTRISLGDLDLREDEIQVAADHRYHGYSPWAVSVKTLMDKN